MNAMLFSLMLLGMEPQQPQTRTDEQPGGRGATANAGMDGTWRVVYCEENGRPKEVDKTVTATVQGNAISFKGGDARIQSLRLEFGPQHTVRVSSDTSTRPGSGQTGSGQANPGGAQPGSATNSRPGGTTDRPGTQPGGSNFSTQGVYVPSQQFLAIAIGTPVNRTGTTDSTRPGQSTTEGSGKTGSTSGQSSAEEGSGSRDDARSKTTTQSGTTSANQPSMVLILQKEGASGRTGQ